MNNNVKKWCRKTFFKEIETVPNYSVQFSGDDSTLPDIQYTSIGKELDNGDSLRFLKVVQGKGRPKVKREVKFKVKPKARNSDQIEQFLPMKVPVKQKQRKARSDKGKKRGSYKPEVSVIDSQIEESLISQKVPRAPLTRVALDKEFGNTSQPSNCYTCDFPLNYNWAGSDSEKVVKCDVCKSFIHKGCLDICAYCNKI